MPMTGRELVSRKIISARRSIKLAEKKPSASDEKEEIHSWQLASHMSLSLLE